MSATGPIELNAESLTVEEITAYKIPEIVGEGAGRHYTNDSKKGYISEEYESLVEKNFAEIKKLADQARQIMIEIKDEFAKGKEIGDDQQEEQRKFLIAKIVELDHLKRMIQKLDTEMTQNGPISNYFAAIDMKMDDFQGAALNAYDTWGYDASTVYEPAFEALAQKQGAKIAEEELQAEERAEEQARRSANAAQQKKPHEIQKAGYNIKKSGEAGRLQRAIHTWSANNESVIEDPSNRHVLYILASALEGKIVEIVGHSSKGYFSDEQQTLFDLCHETLKKMESELLTTTEQPVAKDPISVMEDLRDQLKDGLDKLDDVSKIDIQEQIGKLDERINYLKKDAAYSPVKETKKNLWQRFKDFIKPATDAISKAFSSFTSKKKDATHSKTQKQIAAVDSLDPKEPNPSLGGAKAIAKKDGALNRLISWGKKKLGLDIQEPEPTPYKDADRDEMVSAAEIEREREALSDDVYSGESVSDSADTELEQEQGARLEEFQQRMKEVHELKIQAEEAELKAEQDNIEVKMKELTDFRASEKKPDDFVRPAIEYLMEQEIKLYQDALNEQDPKQKQFLTEAAKEVNWLIGQLNDVRDEPHLDASTRLHNAKVNMLVEARRLRNSDEQVFVDTRVIVEGAFTKMKGEYDAVERLSDADELEAYLETPDRELWAQEMEELDRWMAEQDLDSPVEDTQLNTLPPRNQQDDELDMLLAEFPRDPNVPTVSGEELDRLLDEDEQQRANADHDTLESADDVFAETLAASTLQEKPKVTEPVVEVEVETVEVTKSKEITMSREDFFNQHELAFDNPVDAGLFIELYNYVNSPERALESEYRRSAVNQIREQLDKFLANDDNVGVGEWIPDLNDQRANIPQDLQRRMTSGYDKLVREYEENQAELKELDDIAAEMGDLMAGFDAQDFSSPPPITPTKDVEKQKANPTPEQESWDVNADIEAQIGDIKFDPDAKPEDDLENTQENTADPGPPGRKNRM